MSDCTCEELYPPEDTPEACLVVVINCDVYKVLGHTGRYFHGQINCGGYSGDEVGIQDVPDEHGYWVMENGSVSYGRDPDSGVVDDVDVSGDWRPARLEDFKHFDVDVPECMKPTTTVSSEFVAAGGKVHFMAMCNRTLPGKVVADDQMDEFGTHRLSHPDQEGFLTVSGWHPSDGGRGVAKFASQFLATWFDAFALAKEEGARIETTVNIVSSNS